MYRLCQPAHPRARAVPGVGSHACYFMTDCTRSTAPRPTLRAATYLFRGEFAWLVVALLSFLAVAHTSQAVAQPAPPQPTAAPLPLPDAPAPGEHTLVRVAVLPTVHLLPLDREAALQGFAVEALVRHQLEAVAAIDLMDGAKVRAYITPFHLAGGPGIETAAAVAHTLDVDHLVITTLRYGQPSSTVSGWWYARASGEVFAVRTSTVPYAAPVGPLVRFARALAAAPSEVGDEGAAPAVHAIPRSEAEWALARRPFARYAPTLFGLAQAQLAMWRDEPASVLAALASEVDEREPGLVAATILRAEAVLAQLADPPSSDDRAALQQIRNQIDSARIAAPTAPRLGITRARVSAALAEAFLAGNDLGQAAEATLVARRSLDEVLATRPQSVGAWSLLLLRVEPMRLALADALDDAARANLVARADQIAAAFPSNIDAALLAARARREFGDPATAFAPLRSLLPLHAEVAAQAGLWRLEDGQLDEAETAFLTLATLRPLDPTAPMGAFRVAVQRMIQALDVDRSGVIEAGEFAQDMSTDRASRFAGADADGSGALDATEVIGVLPLFGPGPFATLDPYHEPTAIEQLGNALWHAALYARGLATSETELPPGVRAFLGSSAGAGRLSEMHGSYSRWLEVVLPHEEPVAPLDDSLLVSFTLTRLVGELDRAAASQLARNLVSRGVAAPAVVAFLYPAEAVRSFAPDLDALFPVENEAEAGGDDPAGTGGAGDETG